MVSRMDGIDGGIGAIVGGWGWFWLGSSGGMTILNQPALLGGWAGLQAVLVGDLDLGATRPYESLPIAQRHFRLTVRSRLNIVGD